MSAVNTQIRRNKIMVSGDFTIKNSLGLHMRPAGILTNAMTAFDSDVTIVKDGENINAKSIMHVMAACIKFGTQIQVKCEGVDETAALDKFTELVQSGFGEE